MFQTKTCNFSFDVYQTIDALDEQDRILLLHARQATATAYAPYSRFRVGAATQLPNGTIVTGTNQENASYPAGLCAERTLLSVLSSLSTDESINMMAISYDNDNGNSSTPISPCGICRQSLLEYELRYNVSLRLILSGLYGEVYIVHGISGLLPLSFSSKDLLLK